MIEKGVKNGRLAQHHKHIASAQLGLDWGNNQWRRCGRGEITAARVSALATPPRQQARPTGTCMTPWGDIKSYALFPSGRRQLSGQQSLSINASIFEICSVRTSRKVSTGERQRHADLGEQLFPGATRVCPGGVTQASRTFWITANMKF